MATGIEEHNAYALAYFEAVRQIKQYMPLVKIKEDETFENALRRFKRKVQQDGDNEPKGFKPVVPRIDLAPTEAHFAACRVLRPTPAPTRHSVADQMEP